MKIFKRVFFGLLIFIVVVVVAVYLFLLTQKPQYSGTLPLKNLTDKVDVYFDDYGVPHIYGKNEPDIFCALGYVHAQERLFQMELIRRVGAGRLSELFGSPMIDIDKFFRMLGLAKHAEWSAKEFSKQQGEQFYKNAVAYIAGINQYIESGKTPIEFRLLSIPKEKFTMNDMFLIVDFMSFNFQMGFRTDPLMSKIQKKLGAKYLEDIVLGTLPTTLHVPVDTAIASPSENTPRTCSIESIFDNLPVQPWMGSNAWAVSPSRTQSGKVLFANDTHIGYQQPCVWYEAYLECPGFDLYGSFLAGFPFPAIAHSHHHAWGLTILENDDLDFFEEKTDPLHHNQYFYKGEWKQMELRPEIIHVKDSGDLKFTFRSTVHGPVCNDVIHDFADVTSAPVSACWTLLKFPGNLCGITYQLAKSKSMDEFRGAISEIATPGLNVVYGDSAGNIAWWAAAKLVKRPEHVESRLLLDGSSGNDDWCGYYDFSENPHSVNPASGYVYTCNNAPDTIPGVSIPGYYTPEDRAKVVTAFLNQENKFSIADMNQLNNNVTSDVAGDLAFDILSVLDNGTKTKSALAKKVVEILSSWDGSMQTDDIAPTLFYKLEYEILWQMMGDELGAKDFMQFQQTHIEKNSIIPLLMNDSSVWYDDIRTGDKAETRQQIFDLAFDSTIISLQKQLGDDISQWKWGRVHTLEHGHPIGKQKPLNKFFNVGPFPIRGGNETVNNAGFDLSPDGIYKVKFGPALRRTLDFADAEHAQSVLPTGQSGNFMSKHYEDQSQLFIQCKTRTEWMNKTEIEKNSKDHLVLQPDGTNVE
ncbi:penicillin acylase family protein [soil metagenome]